MSKKFAILLLAIIAVLAQAPERTMPAAAATEETKLCWEKELATGMNPKAVLCLGKLMEEVGRKAKSGVNKEVLEDLELQITRILKSMGTPESILRDMTASLFEMAKEGKAGGVTVSYPSEGTGFTIPPLSDSPKFAVAANTKAEAEAEKQVAGPPVTPVLDAPPVIQQGERRDSMLPPDKKRDNVDSSDFLMSQAARDEVIRLRAEQIDLQKKIDRLQKARRKDEDSSVRKARKELEKQEKNEQNLRKRQNAAEGNADIFCPGEQKVTIYNDGHLLYNRFQAFNRVTVVNTHRFTLRISAIDPNRNKSGQLLDLPPGCTVTLSRSIVPFLETGYGGVRFSYIAQPVDGNAAGKIARSQEFYLYGGNSYQQMNTSVWEIRFY